MAIFENNPLGSVLKSNHLRVHAFDAQMEQVLEDVLKLRYPEAEVEKGKDEGTFHLKKTWLDRLKISLTGDDQSNLTYLKISLLSPETNGCLFQLFGILPIIFQQIVSQGFKNDVIEEVGRDLGARYRVRTEYVRNRINPYAYFIQGFVIMFLSIFGFIFFMANAVSSSYECLFNVPNEIELTCYAVISWTAFFFVGRKFKHGVPFIPYLIFGLAYIIGLFLIAKADVFSNQNPADGLHYVFRISAWIIMVAGCFIILFFGKKFDTPAIKTLFIP